jgi:DNA-binding LacI/PurR family transcriptional regulator
MPSAKAGQRGNGRVTLQILAEYLGLSKTTVSVVVSESPAAKAIPRGTRARILNAARELGYRPNYLASSLRRNKTMSIGILVPELGEGYFPLVMNGVEQYLLNANYFYFTASHYWKAELLDKYPWLLQERSVDGLLFLNTPVPKEISLPSVAVSGHQDQKWLTNVILDHEKAAFLALKHLKELGHRRIAFMKGQSFTLDRNERWESICQVAQQLNIAIDPELCISLEMNTWSPELGYEPVHELVRRRRDFTALFCFNDTSAAGAIRALYDAGIRVPHDVSVIGFDDVVGAKFGIPSLTTVRQPLWQMGQTAAKILLERIARPKAKHPKEIMMQPELVIRESTGPASKGTRRG